MSYIYNLTDTWNAAGSTFAGIKMDVTNTASSASSKLLDLSVSGATTGSFTVDKSGNAAVSGALTLGTPLSSANGGTGLAVFASGYVPYASSSSVLSFNSPIYTDGTNVGVNVIPSANLGRIQVYDASTSAGFVAARVISAAAVAGTSTTYFRVEKGNNYGGAVGGYLAQGVGSGIVLSTLNGGAITDQMWVWHTGKITIGTSTQGASKLTIADDSIQINTAKTPATATATGTTGQICWDSSYIYVCVATNTWKRAAIASW